MKDETAAICSGLCLIHCIATPVLLSLGSLGVIGSLFTAEWVHVVLFIPIALLAFTSLPRGWRQHHHYLPAAVGFTGLLLLLIALFAPHEAEAALSISGGLLLIGGHLSNRHLCRRCEHNQQQEHAPC